MSICELFLSELFSKISLESLQVACILFRQSWKAERTCLFKGRRTWCTFWSRSPVLQVAIDRQPYLAVIITLPLGSSRKTSLAWIKRWVLRWVFPGDVNKTMLFSQFASYNAEFRTDILADFTSDSRYSLGKFWCRTSAV